MDFFSVNIKYGSYAENHALCADGNCGTLTDEDILLARSAFCSGRSPIAGHHELAEVCKLEGAVTTGALWRAATSFKNKAGIFSPESPLYSIAEIEGDISSRRIKNYGVTFVAELYAEVSRFAESRPFASGRELVGALFSAMRKRHVEFEKQPENRVGAGLFFSSLSRRELDQNNEEHFYIDCDISSLIVYVIGRELGWPISLVVMPRHVAVSWSSPAENFIADQGEFFDLSHFQAQLKLTAPEVSHASSPESIVLNNLALELLGRGDYDNAELNFIRALEADPENISALIGMCALKIQFDQLDLAQKYCDQGFRLYPNFEGSIFFMGVFLYKSGDIDSAEKLFSRTLAMNPDNKAAAGFLKNIESRRVDNSDLSR